MIVQIAAAQGPPTVAFFRIVLVLQKQPGVCRRRRRHQRRQRRNRPRRPLRRRQSHSFPSRALFRIPIRCCRGQAERRSRTAGSPWSRCSTTPAVASAKPAAGEPKAVTTTAGAAPPRPCAAGAARGVAPRSWRRPAPGGASQPPPPRRRPQEQTEKAAAATPHRSPPPLLLPPRRRRQPRTLPAFTHQHCWHRRHRRRPSHQRRPILRRRSGNYRRCLSSRRNRPHNPRPKSFLRIEGPPPPTTSSTSGGCHLWWGALSRSSRCPNSSRPDAWVQSRGAVGCRIASSSLPGSGAEVERLRWGQRGRACAHNF